VIYRIAEMLEARRAEFAELIRRGQTPGLHREVDLSVERLVHYAGWTDKLAAVFGGANPVSAPYFSYSAPEPTGVVAVVAPTQAPLVGLVSVIAPIVAGGNACVVIPAEPDACIAISLGEVLATSDVPPGVINLLTGRAAEIAPHLAAHGDVNALDLTGAEPDLRTELERSAAETIKRVYAPSGTPDFTQPPGTARLRAFLETKTVWHPTGALSLAGGTSY
jgi:aldehyde dehydrogenase (NAD+)